MARNIPPGTPDRSLRYIFPPGGRRSLRLAAIGGGAIAVAVAVLYVAGVKRVSSPGPVASSHSPIEARCEQCHDVGRKVTDVRCERCHDPGGSDRFTQAGHVLFGSGNPHKAAAAGPVSCVPCHTDHRGRGIEVKRVDDRDCGSCHAFSSLGRHPEFAAVRAQISTGAGLSFGHQRHIAEAAKQLGKKCEACHEPTADLVGFQPMTFDRHCRACHTKDGNVTGDSEAVPPDLLVLSAEQAGAPPPAQSPAELGRITLSGMKHEDPWVLYNAQRLRRMIDPEGINAEGAALRAQIAYLTQQTTEQALSRVALVDLQALQSTLERQLTSIDARLASKGSGGGDDAALNELRSAVQGIAKQLTGVDPEAAALAADAQNTPGGAQAPTGSGPSSAFNERKNELRAALDAIVARGDKKLTERAEALRKQIDAVQPGSGGQPDVAALAERLRDLDEVLGAVRATGDPQAQYAAGQIGALRNVAQSQINGGLSPDAFEDRRRELLAVLDAIDRTGNPELMGRAAVLRQRVIALQPGSFGDAGLRDERNRTAKLLDRVKLEIELARRGDQAPAAAAPARDAAALQVLLGKLRARLAALQSGGRPGTADTPADVRKATAALSNLLAPCLKCHVLDGARIAPVAADPKVFQRSWFTHKPHVEHAECSSCHKSVETSTKSTDVNEPGVENCQSCHGPSKARADCAACHFYHPPSLARLIGTL
jgi:hypothetical protein